MVEADHSSPVTVDILAQHIALVTLARPEAHNAINRETAEALGQAVDQIEANPAIRVVIITGSGGRSFCAGADLKEVAAGGMQSLFIQGKGFAGFVDTLRSKPWIAAVDGNALAGGCEIALACDMIVATPKSQFGLPEVKRGLIAGAGGAYRLIRRLPANIATELIVSGRSVNAADAVRFGLVNRLAEGETALDVAIGLAKEIADNAPLAVQHSLEIAKRSFDEVDERLAEISKYTLNLLSKSADYREGVNAFIEKRPAIWQAK
ncbi:enoyl-CoA hydratase [Sphingobium faniae]|nr:enoyl-CoA hydratase [Sphingobium faniae]